MTAVTSRAFRRWTAAQRARHVAALVPAERPLRPFSRRTWLQRGAPTLLAAVLAASIAGGRLVSYPDVYRVMAVLAAVSLVASAVVPQFLTLRVLAAAVAVSVFVGRAILLVIADANLAWDSASPTLVLLWLSTSTVLWAFAADLTTVQHVEGDP